MKLGAGMTYHPKGARPPGKARPTMRRQSALLRKPGIAGLGDGYQIPLQDSITEIIRLFNSGGFTPAGIIPTLERTVASCKRQIDLAAQSKSGNQAQSRSEAANNLERAQRMLAEMQTLARAGDVTIYSNPSPTWAAVKDAVLGPYYWLSNRLETVGAQFAVDEQMLSILADAIKNAPRTFFNAAGTVIEWTRDNVAGPLLKPWLPDVPRWMIWGAGGLVALAILRPYVAPVLKRIGGRA